MKKILYHYLCLLLSFVMTFFFWLGVFYYSSNTSDITAVIVFSILSIIICAAIEAPIKGLYGLYRWWFYLIVDILVIPVKFFLQLTTVILMHVASAHDNSYFALRKNYDKSILSRLLYTLFNTGSLSIYSDNGRDKYNRAKNRQSRSSSSRSSYSSGFFKKLGSNISRLFLRHLLPTIIVIALVVGALVGLFILPEKVPNSYGVGSWYYSIQWSTVLLIIFGLIPSAIIVCSIIFTIFDVDLEVPTWIVVVSAFILGLTTWLSVWEMNPEGNLGGALLFASSISFILICLFYFSTIIFKGDLLNIAGYVVIFGVIGTFVLSIGLSYILAIFDIYMIDWTAKFYLIPIMDLEIPIPAIVLMILMVIGVLFGDSSSAGVSSSSSWGKPYIPSYELEKLLMSACRYGDYSISQGSGHKLIVTINGGSRDADAIMAALQTNRDYDLSNVSIQYRTDL